MSEHEYLLRADDVWQLIGLLSDARGWERRTLRIDDDHDPLPQLAGELGITEAAIGERTVRSATVIKKRLLVFFTDDRTTDRDALSDALAQFKINIRPEQITPPRADGDGPAASDSFALWRMSASEVGKAVPVKGRIAAFLAEADRHARASLPASPPPLQGALDATGQLGFLHEEIRALYRADNIPWIIGYSGGKDSTAVVQLVWQALAELPEVQRTKPVHVISTDTLVENPIVAEWVQRSLLQMEQAATEGKMPFRPHRLSPQIENSYWVNLIGKGYPAPRHKFRWCTERMKINPSNEFINSVVKGNGEAILLLGTRKKESQRRERAMTQHERHRVRERLSPNASLPGTLIYTPIEEWSNDDVWMFLMQFSNPWGYNNKDLLTMYQGASPDGECPLVVDTSTPSCGDSRFGCWVCTLVDKDKSMSAMIQNDEEKEWMYPLLEFRNKYLDFRPADGTRSEQTDRDRRDFRRMNGSITIYNSRAVHGPYTQAAREEILFQLLRAQEAVRELGRERGIAHAAEMELIKLSELEEIRRIWVVEKHEIEDILPSVCERATGRPYPGKTLDENLMFRREEMAVLLEVCGGDRIHYELARELLDVERRYRTMSRRSGLFGAIDEAIEKGFFENEEDATKMALEKLDARAAIEARVKGAKRTYEEQVPAV